jgi:hypothetical protein
MLSRRDGYLKSGAADQKAINNPPPPPLPHIMYLPASKTLRTGQYKSLVHRWFYEHENPLKTLAPSLLPLLLPTFPPPFHNLLEINSNL